MYYVGVNRREEHTKNKPLRLQIKNTKIIKNKNERWTNP